MNFQQQYLYWLAGAVLMGVVLAKLVLVDSGGYPYKATSVPIGFKLAQYGALRPVMQRVLPKSMIESSVRNVYGDPSRVTPELVDRYYELTLREGNRAALVERFSQFKGGEWTVVE